MRRAALSLPALLLTGCAGLLAGDSGRLTVAGSVTYAEPVPLPAGSVAVVELRERGETDAPVLAEARVPMRGRLVPVPFEMQLDRASIKPGRRYAARAAIVAPGIGSWAGEPVEVAPQGTRVDLGPLRVSRVPGGGFASVLRCGAKRVEIVFRGQGMEMKVGETVYAMREVPSASGAGFEAVSDPTTTFWSKGRVGTLVLRGRRLPECAT
jgi:uncharacterized lipoprotein YbaY